MDLLEVRCVVLVLLVAGCGGATTDDGAQRQNPTAGASGSEPTTGGATGLGGAPSEGGKAGALGSGGGMDLTPAGFPRCGPLDPTRADDCAGIELITPLDPRASSNLGGTLGLGETGPVSAWVENGDSVEHDDICVGVVVDTPGVTLTPYDRTNPTIVAPLPPNVGPVVVYPAYFHVRDVDPGVTVRFTLWTTYEGTNCTGPTVKLDALIQR